MGAISNQQVPLCIVNVIIMRWSNFVGFKNEIKHIDEFLEYCKTTPTYDEVMKKFPQKLFEYELSGKIKIENGLVFVV